MLNELDKNCGNSHLMRPIRINSNAYYIRPFLTSAVIDMEFYEKAFGPDSAIIAGQTMMHCRCSRCRMSDADTQLIESMHNISRGIQPRD